MKVEILIERLKEFNPKAEVFVNSNYRNIDFTLAFGGDEGVTKLNCETVSIYPDDLTAENKK